MNAPALVTTGGWRGARVERPLEPRLHVAVRARAATSTATRHAYAIASTGASASDCAATSDAIDHAVEFLGA